jgi:hypothetical protein
VGLTPLPWVFGEEGVLIAADTSKNGPPKRRYLSRRPVGTVDKDREKEKI